MALKLPSIWGSAHFNRKQRIQNLLFTEGIFYNRKNDDYRTPKINLLFSAIPYLAENSEGYKKGDSAFLNEIPAWVGERSEISNLLRVDFHHMLKFTYLISAEDER